MPAVVVLSLMAAQAVAGAAIGLRPDRFWLGLGLILSAFLWLAV